MTGVIYCYHCISTGKKYIGKTVHEEKRKVRHKYDSKKGIENKFYRAVRKYGWNKFVYGIIEEYEVNILSEKEVFYIDYFDTYNNGYNSTLGGDGISGFSLSEESKKKMSESAKNRDRTPYIKYSTEEEKREAKRKRDREYHQRTKEKRSEYFREWREKNKERRKEYNKERRKEWYKCNKEKKKKYNDEWRKNNKEYMKEWRERNKDKIKEYNKNYRKTKKCDT